MDGFRRPEGGGGHDPRERPGRGTRGDRRRARRQRSRTRLAPRFSPHPQPGGPRPCRGSHRGRRPPRHALRRAQADPAAEAGAADLPGHDDRLLPADRRDPCRPPAGEGRRDRARRVRGADAGRDRPGDRLPGGDRTRRPRPRGAGAQRHGPVLRRADARLRLHAERLGAVLWLALRAPADHLRRCQPGCSDDRRVDLLRAVEDREAGQGHAHRPGHDARVVVRPRRPAPVGDVRAAGARDPRRGGRPGEGGDPESSTSTSRRSARACRCAATAGTST